MSNQYIHGSRPEEQHRLSGMNTLLNRSCLRELGLAGGEAILDLGSGLGQFSREMAHVAGTSGRVLGIERDPDQLAEARRQARAAGDARLVEWRRGILAAEASRMGCVRCCPHPVPLGARQKTGAGRRTNGRSGATRWKDRYRRR